MEKLFERFPQFQDQINFVRWNSTYLGFDSNEREVIRVTIIILTFNHFSYIQKALESIANQAFYGPFEIIVCEDASTDGTRDKVLDFFRNSGLPVRLQLSNFNLHSLGYKPIFGVFPLIRGEFVALCEGDDQWLSKTKLKTQLDFHSNFVNCDLSFHAALCEQEDGRNFSKFLISNFSSKCELIDLNTVILGGGALIPTASILFRKRVLYTLPRSYGNNPGGDFLLQNYAARRGGALYLPKLRSLYRVFTANSDSLYRRSDPASHFKRNLFDAERLSGTLQDFPRNRCALMLRSKYLNMHGKLGLRLINVPKQISSPDLPSKIKQAKHEAQEFRRPRLKSLIYSSIRRLSASNPDYDQLFYRLFEQQKVHDSKGSELDGSSCLQVSWLYAAALTLSWLKLDVLSILRIVFYIYSLQPSRENLLARCAYARFGSGGATDCFYTLLLEEFNLKRLSTSWLDQFIKISAFRGQVLGDHELDIRKQLAISSVGLPSPRAPVDEFRKFLMEYKACLSPSLTRSEIINIIIGLIGSRDFKAAKRYAKKIYTRDPSCTEILTSAVNYFFDYTFPPVQIRVLEGLCFFEVLSYRAGALTFTTLARLAAVGSDLELLESRLSKVLVHQPESKIWVELYAEFFRRNVYIPEMAKYLEIFIERVHLRGSFFTISERLELSITLARCGYYARGSKILEVIELP